MKELLIKLGACEEAMKWADGKSWEEVYNTCHRGDWLLWLFFKTNDMTIDGPDYRMIKLAAGSCANLVRHLMKDERSVKAVDAAIAYGRGEIGIVELRSAYAAAYASAYAANAAYADAAYSAAAYAAYAASAYAYAAAAAAYAAAAYDAAYAAAKKEMFQKTADVVRSIIKIENFKI